MTLNECVFWIGTGAVLYDTVIAWTLIILYSTHSNWRQFEEGRAWLATKTVFTLVLTYLIVVTIEAGPTNLQNYPSQGIIRIAIFAAVGYVFTWWVVIVLRNQRRSRRYERDSH
jgi:CBS domain containing-hemolysin-like protein